MITCAPVAAVGAQVLRRALEVARDDGVGHVEDRLRGAVVLLQQDDLGVGEVLAEAQDVAIVRAR